MGRRIRKGTEAQRGNAMVEFGLCFTLFLTIAVAMFEFSWLLFVKSTFHHAVREGVRAAITGQAAAGFDDAHDDFIKSVIKTNSFGLLDDSTLDAHVEIEYFALDGSASATPEPGSIIQVSVQCYDIMPITSFVRPRDGNGNLQPVTISVYSSDRLEPFSGAPPGRGTVATATACAPPSS